MKIAYFDCFAGASGDMILSALLDAGFDIRTLRDQLALLHLDGFSLETQTVVKNGLRATKVVINVQDELTERRLPEIERVVNESSLPPKIIERTISILRRIGEVEARIHGVTAEQVHLHELGGLDTIVDVAGTLIGLEALGIERVYASTLPLGGGFVETAHGRLPLPSPATLALLNGIPVKGSDLEVELVTPTGAALLSGLVESWGPLPAMSLARIGYGAGRRDLPIPNVVRLLVGETPTPGSETNETLDLLETNIDDLNPQFYDHVIRRLFEAEALDVWLAPIQMKKNRPGTQLSVLCRPQHTATLESILFTETSTLGIRRQRVERRSLARSIELVETNYGTVRVKISHTSGGAIKFAPEYEDCQALSEALNVPLREVYLAAELAAEKSRQKT